MNIILTIIRKSLLSVSRRSKRLIIASTDFFLFLTASFVSLALNQQSLLVFSNSEFLRIIWIPLLGVFIFTLFYVGLQKQNTYVPNQNNKKIIEFSGKDLFTGLKVDSNNII